MPFKDPEREREYRRERYASGADKAKERYQNRRVKIIEYQKAHYRKKRAKVLARQVERAYGLSPTEHRALLSGQDFGCAICGAQCQTGRRLAVDHDHNTGVVRGLLCNSCNNGLGRFKDDPALLIRAADYLRKQEKNPMTATQFTGGSYKHTDPSNYSTGKQGAEVTIHWSVRDGADGSEQRSIGEEARVEAIRLAMGADQPYLLSGNTLVKSENPTPAVLVVPPMQAAAPAAMNTSNAIGPTVLSAGVATPAVATPVIVQSPVETAPSGPLVTIVASPTETAPGPLAQTSPSSGPLSVPGTTAVPAVVGSVTAATITSPSPESVPEEITDVRLNEAIDHCLKRIHAAAPMDTVSQETAGRKIPALIARYVAPPATFTKIPQEKRAQFMADLELMSTTVGHQKRILDADPNKAPAIGALVNAFVPAGGVLYDLPTENRQQFIDQLAAL